MKDTPMVILKDLVEKGRLYKSLTGCCLTCSAQKNEGHIDSCVYQRATRLIEAKANLKKTNKMQRR